MKKFDDIVIKKKEKSKENKKKKLTKEEKLKLKQDKKQKKLEAKNLKKEDKKIINTYKKISPVIDITDNDEIRVKNGYIDLFKIRTINTYSLNDDEVKYFVYRFIEFLRSYTDDIKIMEMKFPANTRKQQEFINKKLNECDNEIKKLFLDEAKNILEFIENHRKNREFILMIFMKDDEDIKVKKSMLRRSLTGSFIVDELSLEKKIQILFKMNNLNTPIF
ncbi:hypothetical protein QJR26_18435 (plasmid) [Clostridium baratii]